MEDVKRQARTAGLLYLLVAMLHREEDCRGQGQEPWMKGSSAETQYPLGRRTIVTVAGQFGKAGMRVATILAVAMSICGAFVTAAFSADSKTVPASAPGSVAPKSVASPWIGTWSLDTSQSKYSPGPPHKKATITVTDAGNGKLTYVTDITDGTGEMDHTEFTCAIDQTECPVVNGGAKETVSITKLDSRNLRFSWKFNNPPFSVVMLVKMSKDGKTQVAISKGKLPDGKTLAVTEVWRKS